jgi:heat-inducible transcriptional repressor
MDERQEKLLTLVIEHYVATAEPVGSKFLVDKGNLDWSEATVRNELRALEEAGFLTHPHTSAGRIPTEQGYRYYIEKLNLAEARPSKVAEKKLETALTSLADYEQARKSVAKALVELADETVLIAFSPDKIYYTGLSNLFQKPDFAEMNLIADISAVFDRCEEALEAFFPRVTDMHYFIGTDHPFGHMLSVIAIRFGKNNQSLMLLLGPQRMDYHKNWGLMKKVQELI